MIEAKPSFPRRFISLPLQGRFLRRQGPDSSDNHNRQVNYP